MWIEKRAQDFEVLKIGSMENILDTGETDLRQSKHVQGERR